MEEETLKGLGALFIALDDYILTVDAFDRVSVQSQGWAKTAQKYRKALTHLEKTWKSLRERLRREVGSP